MTLPGSDGPSLSLSIEGVCVNWFIRYVSGSHPGEWLALGVVALVLLALCIASLKVFSQLCIREVHTERSEDEKDKEYWRIHEGE